MGDDAVRSHRMRPVLVAASLALLAGCSWFGQKTPAVSSPVLTVESIAAARAACPDYDLLVRDAPFPRDAIIRGIVAGTASVIFAVDGTMVTVLSITSSAPAFGGAAMDAVRGLHCAVHRPARFAIAFDWRNAH